MYLIAAGRWGDFPFDGLLGLGLEDGSGQKSALSQLVNLKVANGKVTLEELVAAWEMLIF